MIRGKRKIYVASSWRNTVQQAVVHAFRRMGHEVYDFRNPPEKEGFQWEAVDANWEEWTNEEYLTGLDHPAAVEGFAADYLAMEWADTFVLVQPCGRSAHLEMGWACGQGKCTVMILGEAVEPELMAKMCDYVVPHVGAALELFQLPSEWGESDAGSA